MVWKYRANRKAVSAVIVAGHGHLTDPPGLTSVTLSTDTE